MSRSRRAVTVLPVLALVATGCGSSTADSAKNFKGEPKAVAQAIDDLRTAGEKRDASKICGELLATKLVDAITAASKTTGKSTCTAAVKESLKDVDSFKLDVVKNGITITGTTATAKVRTESGKDDNHLDTLQLVKETQRRGGKNVQVWKIAALAG